ncbi:ABC transporter ATP-binding protein [Fodinibius sp.]|uniref:ABC transporter ATP-binding protein n=1 Tax=Fodinibius sp. TaxID=1872440 RepID=UPI002ACDFC8C|nr:ABC transporter ATP-binding protein [Fodinibius sp.]MDZ7658346.1 ABC transporter ATP-binding protein [Fodinibius sp.]
MITLSVKQLKKSFGPNIIFSDVSFDHQSTALGIAGSNGSGKSTFLKCIGGLLPPSSGDIAWKDNGTALNKTALKNKLGYAAPYINLYNELSCRENLEFISKMRHQSNYVKTIDLWISKVGLKHALDQPFGKLSTGQQQRLRLASALFHDPDILLLDEPGSNLDEEGRNLITEIVTAFDTPEKVIIIASNNPDELSLCERIFSIEKEAFVK